jgi:hypothetical protein
MILYIKKGGVKLANLGLLLFYIHELGLVSETREGQHRHPGSWRASGQLGEYTA